MPHTYTVISDTAICTKDGVVTKMCIAERSDGREKIYNGVGVCGHTETEPSPAKGHDYEITVVNEEATCFSAKIIKKECKNCHDIVYEYYDRDGNKLEENYRETHTWDADVVTKEPTCTEPGEKTYTCIYANDGNHFVEYGDGTKIEEIPATGHQHLSDPVNRTEDYTGDIYCKDCGALVKKGEKIEHHWDEGKVTKEPTCTEEGEKTYTCTDEGCGVTKTEAVKATGHSWDEGKVTTEPTCEGEGVKSYTCQICHKTRTEKIAKTGHRHTELRNKKAATCSEAGYTGDTYCTDCGKTIATGSRTKALGHSWGASYTVTAATAVSGGKNAHRCTRCGRTESWGTGKLAAKGNFTATNFPLKVKKSYTLKVENMAAGDRVVSWRSSNAKVATVAGNGKVTAQKKTGSTTISATLASGKVISTTVKVQKGNVKTNKVVVTSPRTLTLKLKQGAQIQAVRYPVTSAQGLSYSTSNKKVATVNKKGYITAQKKTGKATITVKSGSKKVKITVKVVP